MMLVRPVREPVDDRDLREGQRVTQPLCEPTIRELDQPSTRVAVYPSVFTAATISSTPTLVGSKVTTASCFS